jgi:hypothetical protein
MKITKYVLKPLKFEKVKDKIIYVAKIKIHDLIEMEIEISTYPFEMLKEKPLYWKVAFRSYNGYRGFDISGNSPGVTSYTRFGFKDYLSAKQWAETEYSRKFNEIIQSSLIDLNNYVEVKYDEII